MRNVTQDYFNAVTSLGREWKNEVDITNSVENVWQNGYWCLFWWITVQDPVPKSKGIELKNSTEKKCTVFPFRVAYGDTITVTSSNPTQATAHLIFTNNKNFVGTEDEVIEMSINGQYQCTHAYSYVVCDCPSSATVLLNGEEIGRDYTETYTDCEVAIEEVFSETDTLSVGKPFSKELTLKVYEPQNFIQYNKNCTLTVRSKLLVGNSYVPVQMGVFFPSEVKTSDGGSTLEIKAYDKMALLNKTYVPNISFPTTAQGILNDIVTQYGLTLESGTTSVTNTISKYYNDTVANTLGYLAGLEGKNAIFNSSGELSFRWYDYDTLFGNDWSSYEDTWEDYENAWYSYNPNSPNILSREDQVENGLEINQGTYYFTSLVSGTEDKTISVGTGNALVFFNPYMTRATLQALSGYLCNRQFNVGKAKCFGNPMFEVGDIAYVEDNQGSVYKFLCSNISWNFNGGCSMAIDSVGYAEAEASEDTSSSLSAPSQGTISSKVESIVDFIVAQGTDEGWTYRKWNSGVVELWKSSNLTATSSTAQGGVYYSNYKQEDLPFKVNNQIVQLTTRNLGTYAHRYQDVDEYVRYRVCGGAISTGTTYYVDIYVVGNN